jgi:phosphoribosylformimino-5-aminoimidazole carboxamide ribotide isomerase
VQLYPAIDVRGGRAARGFPGADPVTAARALAEAGVAWAHVVDLDRALGVGRDDATVRAVIDALAGVRVQLGGGLVGSAEIREVMAWGVSRVVAGAAVLKAAGPLSDLVAEGRVAVALGPGGESMLDSAVGGGVTTVVYRDRDRDGTLTGAALDAAARFLGRGADVILAGGVASLDELRRARDLGFAGAIVGRALLEGRFTLAEAIQCCG